MAPISVKESALVAIIIESFLYGISTFLFGITVWSLIYQRNSAQVAYSMLIAACLLFFLSTMHIIVGANHVWQGFISSSNAAAFFENISKTTFKYALYELETLVGDAILIYRCYVVWQRIELIIVPIIGWVGVAITGTYTVWSISQLYPMSVGIIFPQESGKWLISFYSTAFGTNLIATGILASKLWLLHRHSSGIQMKKSHVYPILILIMECGALYSMSLITIMATYLTVSNSVYIVIDMVGQIIPITFYLIIVRTAMLRFSDKRNQGLFTPTRSSYLPTARPMTVHIDHMTVVDIDVAKASETSSAHINAAEREHR